MADDLYSLMSRGTPKPPEPLRVLDPDADKCCRKAFTTGGLGDNCADVRCPVCGTRFVRTTVGPTQFWRITPEFAIVRRR